MSNGPSTQGNTQAVLIALLPTWLAFAWLVSKAQWFWIHKEDLQFGWIVLLLSAFLIWDQWPKRPKPKFRVGWPMFASGLAGCGLLFLVQIYHAAYGMMPALMMGLCGGVYAIAAANIHYVHGWPGLRFFGFPLLFLLVAMPLPSIIYSPVVNGLQQKVASVNVEVLNILGVPAQRIGGIIQLPNGAVGVDEACSGIRSLQSTIMATLFIGYLSFRSRALQVALLGCGILLAIVGNLVRSLYLSLTANAKGVAAIQGVHNTAGWSILLFTVTGVALMAWLFARLQKWADRQRIESQDAEPLQEPTKA